MSHDIKNPYPVIVDIRPEFDTMIIKQRKNNNITRIFPFLPQKELDNLSQIAHQVAIDSSFEDEYEKHAEEAFEKAKKHYQLYDHRKSRSGSYKRNRRLRKRNLTPNQIPHYQ
jgi:hypothetical protein